MPGIAAHGKKAALALDRSGARNFFELAVAVAISLFGMQSGAALEFDDYRESGGFRLPHQVRYFDRGRLLATERFDQIEVTVTSDVPMSGSGG